MNRGTLAPLLLTLVMGGLWAGCDSRSGAPLPNLEPNTRISAGPPEGADASYSINLFWFGWDDDGFVDYYEIAWESPEEGNWIGPIFANDSLFTVEASDSCCVEPLPGGSSGSVYEQYHTFYVRAVDDRGVRDATPAVRSFNAKTVAPFTEIDSGPINTGAWGTRVRFTWNGGDDDGFVVSYKYALLNTTDYFVDTGIVNINANQLVAWVDTLTYYPRPGGGYNTDSLVWRPTEVDTVLFPAVQSTNQGERIIFAVRSVDNAGATEQVLTIPENVRTFRVSLRLNGPNISLFSNIAGSWTSSDPIETREVFAGQGLRFNWRATPGGSNTPVAGFSYAVDDTALWSPFSLSTDEWPEQIEGEDEILWFPAEIGPHTFFVRAVDEAGFIRVLPARIRVFGGPRFCPEGDRYVLVVLDTQPGGMQTNNYWPQDYEQVELGLVAYWFEGYNIQVHETGGADEPQLSLMDCASSTFWFHSTSVADSDNSVLKNYNVVGPNALPSYIAAGGNLFLCGLQPLNALRYFEKTNGERDFIQNDPVVFAITVSDTSYVPHWMATQFGIQQIQATTPGTLAPASAGLRLRIARSQVTGGSNPYPDLEFDPLTWPNGPEQRGFGFHDRGIIPIVSGTPDNDAEPIYMFNNTTQAVGVRRLSPDGPGLNGNLVYLGFHPYFVMRPQFRSLVQAVLTDFGEFPIPGS
jgi:hypothetical protein